MNFFLNGTLKSPNKLTITASFVVVFILVSYLAISIKTTNTLHLKVLCFPFFFSNGVKFAVHFFKTCLQKLFTDEQKVKEVCYFLFKQLMSLGYIVVVCWKS